jgi:hypothetical protein
MIAPAPTQEGYWPARGIGSLAPELGAPNNTLDSGQSDGEDQPAGADSDGKGDEIALNKAHGVYSVSGCSLWNIAYANIVSQLQYNKTAEKSVAKAPV